MRYNVPASEGGAFGVTGVGPTLAQIIAGLPTIANVASILADTNELQADDIPTLIAALNPTQSESDGGPTADYKTVVTSATQGVYGAWLQFIASTGFASIGILVLSSINVDRARISIGTGSGGSEVEVVPGFMGSQAGNWTIHYSPLVSAIGTRIAIRASNPTGATARNLQMSALLVG